MLEGNKQKIIAHAAECYPRESCGLLLAKPGGKEIYFPCRNLAEGDENFILHPEDYVTAEEQGRIIAIVHSHPNASPKPSQADLVACESTRLPWYIISYPTCEFHRFEPKGYKAPLIGREFFHGVLDCYTLIRDWYEWERNITLPDFERRDQWWRKGENLYMENFEKAGFRKLPPGAVLQEGDVLLMQVLSNVANHSAIYLGDDIILHHLYGRLSQREVYGGYYKKHCIAVLRYGIEEGNING